MCCGHECSLLGLQMPIAQHLFSCGELFILIVARQRFDIMGFVFHADLSGVKYSVYAPMHQVWRVSRVALYLQWPGCAELDVSLSLSQLCAREGGEGEGCICLLALM